MNRSVYNCWVDRTRDAGRSLKDIDLKEVQEKLDSLDDYLSNFAASTSKIANRQFRDSAGRLSTLPMRPKENLAASLVLPLEFGVLIGYLIRRGSVYNLSGQVAKKSSQSGHGRKGRLRGHTRNLFWFNDNFAPTILKDNSAVAR